MGTALKPAAEFFTLARKPLRGTVAANVLAHGTGALNIDACRIEGAKPLRENGDGDEGMFGLGSRMAVGESSEGRWPANVILDAEAARLLDAQTGDRPGFSGGGTKGAGFRSEYVNGESLARDLPAQTFNDSGGASRFFYTAKASSAERNDGLDALEPIDPDVYGQGKGIPARQCRICGHRPKLGIGERTDQLCAHREYVPIRRADDRRYNIEPRRNVHPTVKPVDLMRWLVRLLAPPGALILDPFAGSGTTGVAARRESMRCILIEREAEYLPIIAGRLSQQGLF